MMAAIAVVALGFAVSRVDAAPAVSLCVFVGCTWYLAGRRYAEALDRRAAEAGLLGPGRKARLAAWCALTAAVAIGLPDAAFLGGYYGYMAAVRLPYSAASNARWAPEIEPGNILIGALIGIGAALYVAALMRRGPGPVARKRTSSRAVERMPRRSMAERGLVADPRASTW
jgi:hypothetical protein